MDVALKNYDTEALCKAFKARTEIKAAVYFLEKLFTEDHSNSID
jgi:hypothetical protein